MPFGVPDRRWHSRNLLTSPYIELHWERCHRSLTLTLALPEAFLQTDINLITFMPV
ncbi:hypothetical protein IP91_00337 [Pseudoduganella lurida]|uniref:Uncharacterized protein n=1 Tax=Pseudoduganella lurida TaxID=1036180 RepID=A0A562RLF6_9BURK|nr:hypothetical protein IP91_00337 [Pseudoduganella lurida]